MSKAKPSNYFDGKKVINAEEQSFSGGKELPRTEANGPAHPNLATDNKTELIEKKKNEGAENNRARIEQERPARQLASAYWRPPEVPNLGKGNSANRRPSPAWARGIPPVGVLPYVRVSTVLGRQTFGSCRMA